MCAGQSDGGPNSIEKDPPVDTGEAEGLTASNLTVTFGFGPSVFELDGEDRFGLLSRRPRALQPLPAFPPDALQAGISGGDVCIQACADDPQVAFHAVHELGRLALGQTALRWLQVGFGRTSTTSTTQASAWNLMGFKDGTDNIRGEEVAEMNQFVWVGDEGPAWMEGGTYLVWRKIQIFSKPGTFPH